MKPLIILLLAAITTSTAIAQTSPKSADEVLQEGFSQAAKENKNVFVIFHASWCGWCHKMDTAMNDKSVKEYFDNSYVVKHLTIKESQGKKHLENPGAEELYNKHAVKEQGIPFWLVYDKNGKLLADSQITPGENSGCPATKQEVDYFIKVLKKTSSITPQQAVAVETRFRKNEQ